MKHFFKKLVLNIFLAVFSDEIDAIDHEPEVSKFIAELCRPYI